MQEVKQVIVIRKDLNMRRGKQIAQGAHASMKVILDMMNTKYLGVGVITDVTHEFKLEISSPVHLWLEGLFTKIVVSVDSEGELDDVYKKAVDAGIPCSMIVDAGLTEFKGVPTKTAVAIGPWWSNDIDLITGYLKLL